MLNYSYKVIEINRILDGDTIDLSLNLGFSIIMRHRFRLINYDAPETWRPKTDAEREGGTKVKLFLEEIVQKKFKESNLYCKSSKQPGIYGRYEAELFFIDKETSISINNIVLEYIKNNNLTKEELRKI